MKPKHIRWHLLVLYLGSLLACTNYTCKPIDMAGRYLVMENGNEVLRALGVSTVPEINLSEDKTFQAQHIPSRLFMGDKWPKLSFSGSGKWECERGIVFLSFDKNDMDFVNPSSELQFMPELGLAPTLINGNRVLVSAYAAEGKDLVFVKQMRWR